MTEVSVVVPTYNRADLLPRAMDSVLDQTYGDLELVVVDDGSTDDTGTVVEGYDDPRVRYVAHETNRGANVARNTGIEAADGEYVAFLDSDDEWRPRKLELQMDAMSDGAWVGAYCEAETRTTGLTADLRAAAASVLARADDEPDSRGGAELVGEILADNVQPGAGSTLLVRTDVARDVGGFDEDLDRFQDPEFVLRVLQEGPVTYVDEPLVVRHPTGSPPADVVRTADERYRSKHADAVERAEDRGLDVRGAHELVLTKRYAEEGRFAAAAGHLRRSTVTSRHLPGLLWSFGTGFDRRRRTAGGLLLALGVVLLLVRSLAGSRRA
jgi:glycosyltransferase involved in cell wall biosynthesis